MTTRATRTPRRRTVVAMGSVLIVLCAFGVRLFDIQVVKAEEYVTESLAQTGTVRTIYGSRGDIVDMNGNLMATSTMEYSLAIDPQILHLPEKGDKPSMLDEWPDRSARIGEITGQSAQDIQQLVADNRADNPQSRYALIATGLSTSQMEKIRALDLDYVGFDSVESRTYPNGAVAGNLVGFVGRNEEGTGVTPLAGIESMENSCLTETNGAETFVRGSGGEIIPGSLRVTPAENGGTVKTTIDADLQWYMEQMIQEETKKENAQYGTVTVLDAKTGAIRAAAEYPSVDPNNVSASDPDDRESRIFRETFEPGSTFKAATAAMLLESGTSNPLSTVYAPDYYTFPNGASLGDAVWHDPMNYTLAGALIDSSNVALSMFGEKMPAASRYDYLTKYGVGTPTAVGFPNEAPGLIRDASTWDNQTYYATTFGQGFTMTSPQIASFYQAIANDGLQMPVHLVESCVAADGTETKVNYPAPKQIMTSDTASQMTRMIENVAVQGGVSDLIQVPGYRVAAKTGTAETYDEATGGYKVGRFDTSIVGFAPVDDPQYVVIVMLKEPTAVTSSMATAPAFQKAMTQVLKNYRVLPSATPFTDPLPKTQ